MKCPVCSTTELAMSVREGIEIDYCPQCRGVWLDRGELDQLIRRAEQASLADAKLDRQAWREERERERRPPRQEEYRQEEYRYSDPHGRREHARRKKSFLGDLFDFD